MLRIMQKVAVNKKVAQNTKSCQELPSNLSQALITTDAFTSQARTLSQMIQRLYVSDTGSLITSYRFRPCLQVYCYPEWNGSSSITIIGVLPIPFSSNEGVRERVSNKTFLLIFTSCTLEEKTLDFFDTVCINQNKFIFQKNEE